MSLTKSYSEEDGRTKFIENVDPNRPLSRYNKTRLLLNEGNIPVQETWVPPNIPIMPNDRYFQVTKPYAHRPDIISKEFYGTEHLYWIIALANNMIDSFAETIVGKRLRIPDPDNIFATVLSE